MSVGSKSVSVTARRRWAPLRLRLLLRLRLNCVCVCGVRRQRLICAASPLTDPGGAAREQVSEFFGFGFGAERER